MRGECEHRSECLPSRDTQQHLGTGDKSAETRQLVSIDTKRFISVHYIQNGMTPIS